MTKEYSNLKGKGTVAALSFFAGLPAEIHFDVIVGLHEHFFLFL